MTSKIEMKRFPLISSSLSKSDAALPSSEARMSELARFDASEPRFSIS